MKLPLLLSILTSISAVRIPNGWQQHSNGNVNANNPNIDVRPIREEPILNQPRHPNYNNVNNFIGSVPNVGPNGLVTNGHLFSNIPLEYNWFSAPNADFNFINPTNQISIGSLVNNNLNTLPNDGSQIRRKPPLNFQRQGPPRLLQSPVAFKKPPVSQINPDIQSFKQAPGKVPYITATTQEPVQDVQETAFSGVKPTQNSGPPRILQVYPQVTSPKTTLPLKELDFSPRNPFPPQGVQSSVQKNNHNVPLSTTHPINGFDFKVDNPFTRNVQLGGFQGAQTSRIPFQKPLFTAVDNRKPNNNPTASLRNLEFNPFTKNYRDHRTHEPTQYDPHYDVESVPKIERLQSEKAPVVKNHEYLPEVPTKPIYPGEGQWAKPRIKHKPFVSKQQYANLEESNEKPDGYDTFLEGQRLFENQNAQFGQKLQNLPSNHQPTQQSSSEDITEETEPFIPTRLYAQVRHSEDEKHLPPESDENGRLKELIKDTKIQTIYSEEGYEDSAYDHAGHEKKAESSEGYESDEKKEEEDKKKKIPVKKIDRQSASYAIGDQNLKEEDLEKLKNEDLTLEHENDNDDDSQTAGTHESYLNKVKPTKTKEGNKKANSFVKSKEVKTVTAKDKKGGNIEMEISSEVKAIVQPNNSTKFHKYVKIFPKTFKDSTKKDIKDTRNPPVFEQQARADRRNIEVPQTISIEEIAPYDDSNQFISTTPSSSEYGELVTMEIPITTHATTAISKLKAENDDEIKTTEKRPVFRLKLRKRRRRSAVGIPTIEIDTDFIDKINHDIGKPTEKSKSQDNIKYPYYRTYKEKGIHENSPLRYAEDIKNVPIKTEGKLAFYDLADRKMACSEVNPEVDPVPERIKNADESVEDDEEDEEGNDPASKKPRLGQLGDKIDCFKAKYFGENPLDNPFFQEETVGTIKPIFSEIENISTKKIGSKEEKEHLKVAASIVADNVIDNKSYKYNLVSWYPGKHFGMGENTERESRFVNHFVDKNPKINVEAQSNGDNKAQNSIESAKETQTLEPATLITTPKYSIDLKPKHIYDQIQLLAYLPDDEIDEVKKEINADILKMDRPEVTTSLPNKNKTETVLDLPIAKKRKSGKKNSSRKPKVLKNSEESRKMETSDERKPESFPEVEALQLIRPRPKRPLYEIFDVNKFLPKVPKIPFPTSRRIAPTSNQYLAPVSIVNPTYAVFDVNKYLPTTPFPLFKDFISQSTVLPKYKVISEVFYKEDIKPNEQLNVFTDVLNNIKNFPSLKDSFPESSQPVSIKIDPEKILEKYPQNFFHDENADKTDYFSSTITTITTTFEPKMYASNHKYVQGEVPMKTEVQGTDRPTINSKRKRRRRIKTTTTQETPVVIEQSTSTLRYISEPTEVMGLMPPTIGGYKTIYHPKRDNSQHISGPTVRIEERKINKYFVRGMRPPPRQKVYLYSDFLTDNHIETITRKPKRTKRNAAAQRPAYAQLSRNKSKPTSTETPEVKKEEEPDDYVPQRKRNYHYDEETGKIVYDKKPQETTEEDEEIEYIEVVEETPKTTEKPKQSPIFATATPPPEGQSYTDFVKLLKSASNYHEIPDPTTTEKGAEDVTQKMVPSTLQPVSTSPPEFLSILAKVRNDTTYKLIEDKTEKKKSSTTSSPAEEEVEANEDGEVGEVKNSPGGQGYDSGTNLEIFDISDFLPNIKSYLPKTSVDTSKYKTIERPQVRHTLSSRYKSGEEKNLQDVNTNQQPLMQKGNAEKVLTRGAVPDTIKEEERLKNSLNNPTTTPASETTTKKPVRILRRRTTTPKSTTLEASTQSTSAVQEKEGQQDQPVSARGRRRRRPKKITPTSSTESSMEAEETTKILRRRSERDSHLHAEGNEQYEQIVESDDVPPLQVPKEDYVDYVEIPDSTTQPNNTTEVKLLQNISNVAKKVVDIFKNYDKNEKHGGNYKKEDEVVKQDIQQQIQTKSPEVNIVKVKEAVDVFKEYDKTKKHGGNYKAEKDGIKIKDQLKEQIPVNLPQVNPEKLKESVEVFKDYDKIKKHGGNYKSVKGGMKRRHELKAIIGKVDLKNKDEVQILKEYDETKKHGGNYRREDESGKPINEQESGLIENESIQIKNVNVFQDYEKDKRHSGNYKSEKDALEVQKNNTNLQQPVLLANVEIFKDYDKAKQHGGNYKPESKEQQMEETQSGSFKNIVSNNSEKRNVEIFKNYDKSKQHGGNYISETDTIKTAPIHGKNEAVEVFRDFDQEKKTGGNYRGGEELEEPTADETNLPKTEQKRYIQSRKDVQRLADVVLKPEAIYSDLKLPLDINALKIVKDLSTEEIEEIAESVDEETSEKLNEEKFKREDPSVVKIGSKNKAPVTDIPVTSTKKPLFIKDPSKRLYFYAPVR